LSVRLPAAERVTYLAHQAEEAAGNGTGWRTEGVWLVAEGPLRPFTLYWWPQRDEAAPRLHMYACGDEGLAVVVPPRQAGPTLPRDVRVLLNVADAARPLAERVVQAIRAGLGEQDTLRVAASSEGATLAAQASPAACVQTLVITDGTRPQPTAFPEAHVIGLGPAAGANDLWLDPLAAWSRNQANLEAFLAPLESVCARALVLKSARGEVLAAIGDLGAIGLNWRTWSQPEDAQGPCELVGIDGPLGAQAASVVIPHEAAWRAFRALIGRA
jgi:hypothetical protein